MLSVYMPALTGRHRIRKEVLKKWVSVSQNFVNFLPNEKGKDKGYPEFVRPHENCEICQKFYTLVTYIYLLAHLLRPLR